MLSKVKFFLASVIMSEKIVANHKLIPIPPPLGACPFLKLSCMGVRLVSPEILTLEASRGKTCQPKPKAMQIKATQLKLPARSKQVKFCHLTI